MNTEPIAPSEGHGSKEGVRDGGPAEVEVFPETRIVDERTGNGFLEGLDQIKGEGITNGAVGGPNRQSGLIVPPGKVPASASWFDLNAIHRIEKEMLPEFFKGAKPSKTPEVYTKYRNFIIALYRMNPRNYLSATTCRRNLVCSYLT